MQAGQDKKKSFSVMLVGPALAGGGAENRFRLTAENLYGGKVEVGVFKGDGAALLTRGQRVLHLSWRGLRSYPSMVRTLRKHIKSRQFDAMLAFGFYPNIVAWFAVLGLRHRPALILSEIIAPHQESLEITNKIRRLYVGFLRRLTYSRTDFFAANSEDGLSESIRYYGVNAKHARRIPNLVERDRLERLVAASEAPNISEDALSICMVVRLTRQKRVETLLKAVAGLPLQSNWRVDIVGDGEERSILEDLSRQLGISKRVSFHGWQKNPYPFIAQADISVLSSEYEGFSNSVLEALTLGTPVITSLYSRDAFLMAEQGASLGFPVGDHKALCNQLAVLLVDPVRRQELSNKGKVYAQRHMLPGAIKEYEALVLDAIEQRNKRHP